MRVCLRARTFERLHGSMVACRCACVFASMQWVHLVQLALRVREGAFDALLVLDHLLMVVAPVLGVRADLHSQLWCHPLHLQQPLRSVDRRL